MKILICYHTVTGNTEKVAKSINQGLKDQDVTLILAKDMEPSNLSEFDVIFLGSGVYAASVGKYVKNLIKKADTIPLKFVLFHTHASDKAEKCFYRVEKQLTEKGASILGKFECYGDTYPKQDVLETMTEEEKRNYLRIKDHPNAEDLENAEKFAEDLLKKL